jgi:hypothetical protein
VSLLDGIFGRRFKASSTETMNRTFADFEGLDWADDLIGDRTILRGGPAKFTAVKTAPYTAAAGELVRLGTGATTGTLPKAASCPGACVGFLQTVAQTTSVAVQAGDSLGSAVADLTTVGSIVVLKSDGATKWWIVSRHTA